MQADEQQADQAQMRWDELATHSEVLYPLSCVSGYIRSAEADASKVAGFTPGDPLRVLFRTERTAR